MKPSLRCASRLVAVVVLLVGLSASVVEAQWTVPGARARRARQPPIMAQEPPVAEIGLSYGVFSPNDRADLFGGGYWLNLKPGSRVGITVEYTGYAPDVTFAAVGPRVNFPLPENARGFVQVLGGTMQGDNRPTGLAMLVGAGVTGWTLCGETEALRCGFGLEVGWNRGWNGISDVSAFRSLLRLSLGF